MAALRTQIKASADRLLWNQTLGVFVASAGGIEHDRVDVWGNAMAGAAGFASAQQSRAIFDFFRAHEDGIFFEGQVRETPCPQHWKAIGYSATRAAATAEAAATVLAYQNG